MPEMRTNATCVCVFFTCVYICVCTESVCVCVCECARHLTNIMLTRVYVYLYTPPILSSNYMRAVASPMTLVLSRSFIPH